MNAWKKSFPVPLFTAKDGSPITAFLHVCGKESIEEITQLFMTRGGQTVSKVNKPFTITLTDQLYKHNYTKRPLFGVQWIFDCVEAIELLDIQIYLINKTPVFRKRNFMDVIYHKIETIDGTLLAIAPIERARDSYEVDQHEESIKPKKRRGPEKKKDCVFIEVESLSDNEDFHSQLALTASREAADRILLNERLTVVRLKNQLGDTLDDKPKRT